MSSEIKFQTMQHIQTVRNLLNIVIRDLTFRSDNHDQSKLFSPEQKTFEIYTPKLKSTTYGSDEYNQYLKEMKVALEHHYKINRHHPEHFVNGIIDMHLIDLIEMFCDWVAATKRHADGNIYQSIDHNQKRFAYSDDLKAIFINTAKFIEK